MVAKGSRDRRSSSSTSPSTKRRTSTTTQEKKKTAKPMGICSFCMGDENKNTKGVPEDMIACAECGNCGHPSCLRYSDKLVEKIKTIRWQCLDCKRCIICSIGDDSLLFCDFCDAAIHPKCCDPPLQHIPKGDFACLNCRQDGIMKSNRKKTSLTKTSSTRSLRSKTSSEDETTPTVITRPVAQLIDGMSNFFLPKKDKINNSQRQQSIQKAMKYLRTSKSKLLAHSPTRKNQLLARSVLAASKTSRLRRKPLILSDETPSNSQINNTTPVVPRRSMNKNSHPSEESVKKKSSQSIKKRKHSTSPIPPTPIPIKKRTKNESSMKKTPSKPKENKTEDDEDTDKEEDEHKKSIVPKRKLNLDLSKYKTPPSFLHDSLPDIISSNDVYIFLDARKNSTKLIEDCSEKFINSTEPIEQDANNPRWPPYIVFGTELIKTWYSSSYPQEYARVPRLFICEFCLKYMKCEQVYDRHRNKCTTFHPPANEIYHKDDLSVFEVDGNIDRIYCQNLCLLAKLFLDHKTLYYDVEPFLFYVLTKNDKNGCHFLGYFSKEKHCPQKYNLSCITVLPNCQRRGYGRFLIELSYLLSQKEGQIGTPERPLSIHGAQTYEAYWKIKIVEQLLRYHHLKKEKCVLKDLMNETGMAIEDILDTLQNLEVLTMKTNEKPVIHIDISQLETIIRTEKIKHAHWVSLHSDCVRFTPVLKPILLITDGSAVDSLMKEVEVVFKKIEPENTESMGNAGESADGTNPNNTTEVVRLIRRRKFGRKRRSYFVKYRVSTKPETNTTNHVDEQSQEYITRRRDSIAEKSTKDEDEEEEEVEDQPQEQERSKTPSLPSSPVKSPSKETKYKQLTLDQFLKKLPSKSSAPEETSVTNEEPVSEVKPEEFRSPRRTKRLSNTHTSKSETDLVKMGNGTSEETSIRFTLQKPNSFTRQVSETTLSSNDSPPASINSPLPFKKRAWTSSNVQALTDPSVNPKKTETPSLSRETSITTPSSLADLANPLFSSSSSLASTDEETKIARIESQLKTSIEVVKEVDAIDDQPPSLTSPTSMIVSQSNHYNYPTRSTVAKQQHQQQQQQQQQALAMNNFTNANNINYNYGSTPYAYPYPPVSTMDMSSYYYPSPVPLSYLPYYPPSTAPMYPTGQTMCYPPNTNPYSTNPNGSYNYSTPQSSSNRHM